MGMEEAGWAGDRRRVEQRRKDPDTCGYESVGGI